MISRRNIRVKVMQTLYTMSTLQQTAKPGESVSVLQKHFDQSRQLLLYLLYFLTEVGRYAETDSHNRASKHLPSAQDLNVNTKIAGNEWLWQIRENPGFEQYVKQYKTDLVIDKELVRKIYLQLVNTPEYQLYINKPSRTAKEESAIMQYIFESHMLGNEVFISHIEENFSNLDDDGEMIIQLIHGLLQKPAPMDVHEIITKDKLEFAKSLLQTVKEKDEYLQELIIPKLKNWDPERIALLDMILMKMGVSEFLYFETIPPKVTINEYIDLAKEYSTAQSGQFVNGILDNIHKDLVEKGEMNKVSFKKPS